MEDGFFWNILMFLFMSMKKMGKCQSVGWEARFHGFIIKEGLMDLDLQGTEFTQNNKRIGDECIQACLDRVLISPYWTKDFVYNLQAIQKIGLNQFLLIFTTKNIHFRKEKNLLDLKKCGFSTHSLKTGWLNGGTLTLMVLLFFGWLLDS